MSFLKPADSPWTSRLLSILRIAAGLMFMLHGTQKMFGFPASPMSMPFDLLSQMGLAGVLETFGGAMIVLGFITRPVAFILAGEMAVAYFQAHLPKSIYPVNNGGEAAVLYCFTFLYLMMAGGGPWSIDALLTRSSSDDADATPRLNYPRAA